MTYQFRGFVISDNMLESLQAYAERGQPVGDFLTAVLANDLMDACGRADDTNIRNLPAFAAWVYNECPSPAHGSREKMKAWIKRFRIKREAAVYDTDPQASSE